MMHAIPSEYDLLVIGSGPAGYKSAVTAAQLGAKVAIVEKGLPGGTCLNQGCVPKETLIRLARVIQDVNSLNGHGISGQIKGDFRSALLHKNNVIQNIRSTLAPWLRQLGIRLIQGAAEFVDASRLNVKLDATGETVTLKAKRFIIATGSRPRQHASCKTNGKTIINSRDFMFTLEDLPQRVLCLGGGAVGTELAYLMHQFGARVTIADQASRLLEKPCITERASQTLERKFKQLGIEVKKNVTVDASVICDDDVRVLMSDGTWATFDRVLVAIGREPNTDGLGLENCGVKTDVEGFIQTNAYLESTAPGIYAVGDVKRGPMTANAAFHDAKVAAANAMQGNQHVCNYNRVPIVIDSAIQIASVGLTEERAEDAGFEPDVARINLAGSTKARITHDSEGYIEVVHDEETGQLLGGTIVGPQAGEMIQLLTAACQSSRGLWMFTDISYSHPSWHEELENAIGGCVSSFAVSGEEIFRPGIYATS